MRGYKAGNGKLFVKIHLWLKAGSLPLEKTDLKLSILVLN